MKLFEVIILGVLLLISIHSVASDSKNIDISEIISIEEFSKYRNVGDFIDSSPKITIVVKSLTGSDCDRNGKMDNNAKCNAVYFKLWKKYER